MNAGRIRVIEYQKFGTDGVFFSLHNRFVSTCSGNGMSKAAIGIRPRNCLRELSAIQQPDVRPGNGAAIGAADLHFDAPSENGRLHVQLLGCDSAN